MRRISTLLRAAYAGALLLAAATPAAAQSTDTPPVPLTQAQPVWPAGARQDSVEGRVTLNVYVGSDGRVTDVQTLRTALTHAGTGVAVPQSSPYYAAFIAAASTSARQWTFTPAQQGGTATPAWMTLPMRFQMGNGTIEAAKTACAVPSGIGRGAENTFLHFAEPRSMAPGRPATEADRGWLTCVAGRLNPNATSQEVRDYQSAAVATLAVLGGR